MGFKSFLIGFISTVVVFLMVGAANGYDDWSRYQIKDDSSANSATIIDTHTGIAKKIQKGRVVETYNFDSGESVDWSRYQIKHDGSVTSATIIDTETGIAKKIQKGRVVETYNFNAE